MKNMGAWVVTLLTCLTVFVYIFLGVQDSQALFRQTWNGNYWWLIIIATIGFVASYVLTQGSYKSLEDKK